MSTTYQAGEQVNVKVDGAHIVGHYHSDYRGSAVIQLAGDRRVLRNYAKISKVATTGAIVEAQVEAPIERLDVNKRFVFVERLVDMLVRGQSASMLLTGPGGMGKSHTVFNRLKLNELGDADFHIIKGYSTAKAMYRAMHDHNGKIIVFDDCDSVLKNETSVNLLKSGLDSYAVREVSWLTELGSRDDLPNRFEFTGRVIFISNLSLKQVPQPVVSRSLYVDLDMTPDEKIARISAIAPALCGELEEGPRNECIELLDSLKYRVKDLNLRTMQNVARIRGANPTCWKEMASYMITALN